MILNLNCKSGHGHMTVDLEKFLPATLAQWRKLVRVETLKGYKAINLYAQAERNNRLGIIPNAAQLEFQQRYVYGGCYRSETWQEYCQRKNIS